MERLSEVLGAAMSRRGLGAGGSVSKAIVPVLGPVEVLSSQGDCGRRGRSTPAGGGRDLGCEGVGCGAIAEGRESAVTS